MKFDMVTGVEMYSSVQGVCFTFPALRSCGEDLLCELRILCVLTRDCIIS
jgi:hypothetical protein